MADLTQVESDIYESPDGVIARLFVKEEYEYRIWPYDYTMIRHDYACPEPAGDGYYVGGPGDVYLTKYNGHLYAVAKDDRAQTYAFVENTNPQGPYPSPYSNAGPTTFDVGSAFALRDGYAIYFTYVPESPVDPSGKSMDGAIPVRASVTSTITLDHNEEQVIVHAVQGDTNRRVMFVIADEELHSGYVCYLRYRFRDGTTGTASATLNLSNNAFTATLTSAITSYGLVACQLAIYESSASDAKLVSTYTFYIDVQKTVVNGNPVEQEVWEYPWGGGVGPKNITANGTYNAMEEELDGYDVVTIAVPSAAGVSF